MLKVFKRTDKIEIKVGADVSFFVSPMSYLQKGEIAATFFNEGGKMIQDRFKAVFLTLKYSIKDVKGLVSSDGEEYKLSFDNNGNLLDEVVDEILNTPITEEVATIANNLINGIPSEIIGANGEVAESIKVVFDTKDEDGKKK